MKGLLKILPLLVVLPFLMATKCNKKGGCYDEIDEQALIDEGVLEVWEYQYENSSVYYLKYECCDRYNTLYNDQCTYMCAPDGGITGKGDGKCPEFHEKKEGGKLIWQASNNNEGE